MSYIPIKTGLSLCAPEYVLKLKGASKYVIEKEMATHSGIFAWEIPRTEEPSSYSLCGHKESDSREHTCKAH